MNFFRTFYIAFRALLRNKMRSFLTVLGVIIGVGAVIAMVAIGEGAKARVQSTFEKMGTNMLVVRAGSSRRGGVRGGSGSQQTITWADVEAIRNEAPSVALAAPQMRSSTQAISEGANWTTNVEGVTRDYFTVRNWTIAQGDFFSEVDNDSGAKVAVLGSTVARELFGEGADPLGLTVRLNNQIFVVIGVTEPKGQSGWGQDYDDAIFIPIRTFGSKISGGLQKYLRGTIYVSAISSDHTSQAQAEIEEILRRRHKIRPGQPDDFSVRNLAEIASARQEGAETMTRLLAGIALVSLLVGGIGIMNIMLVSVTERTREIGLRMSIGAKPRDILMQFVVEAVALSLVGGLIGVAIGVGAAKYLAAKFGWSMLVKPSIVALAVGFSAAIGIGFGMYPAHKASRLDPIQALRYE